MTKRKLEDVEKNADILVGMQDAEVLADASANKENSNHDQDPYENTQFETFDDDALDSVDSFKALSKQVSSIEDCQAQARYEMSLQGEKVKIKRLCFLIVCFLFIPLCTFD